RPRQSFVKKQWQSLGKAYGVPGDVAIPAPHTHGGRDERNFHAHILMTTRTATAKGLGEKVRELDQNSTLQKIREKVADRTNVHLKRAGLEVSVDHSSHKDRGIDIPPTFQQCSEHTTYSLNGQKPQVDKMTV
ncbi:MobA/MobL family protein, partial [Acinetobacter baumannii]|uniref:MobA/MobL family protein n=1 Tax=Acinetobacter baumannii TaxID=470 RepID=UPI001C47FC67